MLRPYNYWGGAIDRACCYFCKVDRILGKRAIDRKHKFSIPFKD
ncbi:MAG: hypothetical protein ACRC62_24365 [Microcoleus sp.]